MNDPMSAVPQYIEQQLAPLRTQIEALQKRVAELERAKADQASPLKRVVNRLRSAGVT